MLVENRSGISRMNQTQSEALHMNFMAVGLIGIAIMVTLILLGVNIGMAMFAIGFLGFAYVVDVKAAFSLFKTVPFSQAASFSLSVIPLVIVMGKFAFRSGLSDGLFDASRKWFSKMPGSLGIATIAAAAGFSAICGSTVATAATMTTIALPEMRKYGYDPGLATGTIVAGGTLGVLIPPSTVFILYGIVAEQSIGRLFAAGVVPGLLLALLYSLTVLLICKLRPGSAPPAQSFSWGERIRSIRGVGPVVLLFIAVIGGMFTGFFTANEAASIGAVIGLVFMAIRRKLTLRTLFTCLRDSISTTAMIFQVLLGAYVFNYFLSVTRLPTNLAEFVVNLNLNRYIVVLFIMVVFLVLGCIMDSIPIVLLTVPIFLPIIQELGFDPIWYGVLMVLASDQGLMTPPVGMNVYVVAGMAKDIPMQKIFAGTVPFVAAIFVCIVIAVFFPQLSLWLPTLIYG
jgi:tripartite ATP-independent transporter DctM subunit